MSQVMEHVQQIAGVIGPRPAATDAEARAADYIEGVFDARGLEVERQEFDCPRTYAWGHVVCNLLTVGAAVLSIWWGLPALVLAVAAAILLLLDLDTRFSIARIGGRGPSQNIIARHVPRQRRGERLQRVVVVAHYDSAKPSLVFSPGLVKNLRLLLGLVRWSTIATAVVIALGLLLPAAWKPWTGYAACAAAAYLVLPILMNVQRELLMHATDGANDNASGVAAMLGVMEATVPEPDEAQLRDRPRRRGADVAFEVGVVPDEAVLEYREVGEEREPAGATPSVDNFGDIDWDTGRLEPVQSAAPAPVQPAAPATPERAVDAMPSGDWTADSGVDSLWDEPEPPAATPEPRPTAPRPAPSPVPARWDSVPIAAEPEDSGPEGQERLALEPEEVPVLQPASDEEGKREGHGISSWLGIGRGFDVRKAGKKIGSWDNIEATDDDDDFGFKAGTAGDLDTDDEGSTTDVAARIRRYVTENVDRALSEKEIWFVATGADEAGMWGMRAFLAAYEEDLRDALIVNIDTVGAGTVAFITDEGLVRSYHSDRRLIAAAKRTVRENGLSARGRSYRGMATSSSAALARRFKAMSVMAFDINGRLPNWHWHTDTVENVSPQTVEQAAVFVTALLRDL